MANLLVDSTRIKLFHSVNKRRPLERTPK